MGTLRVSPSVGVACPGKAFVVRPEYSARGGRRWPGTGLHTEGVMHRDVQHPIRI